MPSAMTVLGALNLNARNFEVELRRAVEKLENGMSGFLTQPVLSAQAVENLRKARQTLGERAKILAGYFYSKYFRNIFDYCAEKVEVLPIFLV